MAKIFGQRIHGDRLQRLSSPRARQRVGRAVRDWTGIVAQEAKSSIIEGAISGPGHVPSAPGEPPNADTHALDQSIHTLFNPNTLMGTVTADADHAVPQEFGTAYMEERPYLRPAGRKHRPTGRRMVRDAINRTNRGN